MRYKRLSVLIAIPVVVTTDYALVSSRTNSARLKRIKSDPVAASAFLQNQVSASVAATHFRSGRILPQLHFALKALGDRLEQAGKERLTVIGVLRQGESQPVPFTLVSELPGRARLTLQNGIGQRTFVFDGERALGSDGSLNQRDLATLETLIYDTAERFFMGQMSETVPRALGSNFRADDGATPNYTGPFYDIYQVTDNIKTGPALRRQNKLYCFNSATQLLERVRYTEMRSGRSVEVEVQFDDWRSDQNQRVARRITRLENNAPVLTLTITSAVVGPQVQDRIFGAP